MVRSTRCLAGLAGAALLLAQGAALACHHPKSSAAAERGLTYRQPSSLDEPSATATPSLITPKAWLQTRVQIQLEAKLAQLAIEERLLADFRTGAAARELGIRHYEVAPMSVAHGGDEPGALEKARTFFKSTHFEWPEFLPRALR